MFIDSNCLYQKRDIIGIKTKEEKMTLADVIEMMQALHGEAGVRELMRGLHRYEDDNLILHSSVLVDDLNDMYREEEALK